MYHGDVRMYVHSCTVSCSVHYCSSCALPDSVPEKCHVYQHSIAYMVTVQLLESFVSMHKNSALSHVASITALHVHFQTLYQGNVMFINTPSRTWSQYNCWKCSSAYVGTSYLLHTQIRAEFGITIFELWTLQHSWQ